MSPNQEIGLGFVILEFGAIFKCLQCFKMLKGGEDSDHPPSLLIVIGGIEP